MIFSYKRLVSWVFLNWISQNSSEFLLNHIVVGSIVIREHFATEFEILHHPQYHRKALGEKLDNQKKD